MDERKCIYSKAKKDSYKMVIKYGEQDNDES